jgi:hypothetical protein
MDDKRIWQNLRRLIAILVLVALSLIVIASLIG